MTYDHSLPLLDVDSVLSQIQSGVVERDTAMRLLAEMSQASLCIPLELELYCLEQYILDDPSRTDLKRRSLTILKELGRPIPSELSIEMRDSYVEEEFNTDFQAMMADYASSVGTRDMEEAFFKHFASVRKFTMTSVERLYSLWDATRYVTRTNLPGALVECGVWRGGSMMLIARIVLESKLPLRDLWLYDTFSGLPRPDTHLDVDILGNRAIDAWQPRNIGGKETYWGYATEDDVRTNIASTGYPSSALHFVPGLVEETIPSFVPDKISLLRIDTDWYSSYRHILHHMFDRVVPGGVIIFDDYGQFLGAKKATDEFLSERGIYPLLLRVDYSCRIMIKC